MTAATTIASSSPPTTFPVVELLDLASIRESKSNPRKTFLEVAELAEDLKRHGILQPVLVRPLDHDAGTHELVFGARRFRAAKLAKLTTIPAMVRVLDDAKVLELQVVENSQREDLHPLEEAEGYEQLHRKHGLSVEDIADKVGKSKAAVYARMKLLDLVPDARKAFYAERLTPSTALYLARVPADLQKEALAEIARGGAEPLSARDALHRISTRFMLKLADAPFDRGDAQLVPAAGSCKDCPKRTGNQRELFADVKSDDVCTDPGCFDDKRKAHAKLESKRLEAKGIKVLAGRRESWGDIKAPTGTVTLDHYSYEMGRRNVGQILSAAKAKGFEAPRTVFFDEHGKMVDVISTSTLAAASKKAGIEKKKPYASPAAKDDPKRKAREKAFNRVSDTLVAMIRKSGAHDDALWRVAAVDVVYRKEDVAKLARAKGRDLIALVFGHIIGGDSYDFADMIEGRSKDCPLATLCAAFKVDAKKIAEEELAKIAPKTKATKSAKVASKTATKGKSAK